MPQQHPTLAPSVKQLPLDSVLYSLKSWNSFPVFSFRLFLFFSFSTSKFISPLFFRATSFVVSIFSSSALAFSYNRFSEVKSSNRPTGSPPVPSPSTYRQHTQNPFLGHSTRTLFFSFFLVFQPLKSVAPPTIGRWNDYQKSRSAADLRDTALWMVEMNRHEILGIWSNAMINEAAASGLVH